MADGVVALPFPGGMQGYTLQTDGTYSLNVSDTFNKAAPGDIGATTPGRVFANILVLTDGVAEPATIAGKAQLYVDIADGDLKIKYGDGVVKVVMADS